MSAWREFWRHVCALSLKESRQILRDKSAILVGGILPVLLIILFGYGISFDVKDIRLAVAASDTSSAASLYTQALTHNDSFSVTVYPSRIEALQALDRFDAEAALIFEKQPNSGEMQLLVNGIDAPRASMVANAVLSTIQNARGAEASSGITVLPRVWFNESVESRWYLVPGLIVVILTMIGTMLTGLVIAREWERGTMEALLATPISPWALLLSKIIPYFALGAFGWLLCVAAAVFWYDVPVRGGLWLIALSSALYLLVSLCIGLVISAATRSLFLSSQIALLASFLPAVILSGFIFDLRCAPAWADTLARLLPPVYFLELLKVGFLTGGMQTLVVKNLVVLAVYAVGLLLLARGLCQKRVRP